MQCKVKDYKATTYLRARHEHKVRVWILVSPAHDLQPLLPEEGGDKIAIPNGWKLEVISYKL